MAAEGGHGPLTTGDYISHHLQNLQACKAESGEWVMNIGHNAADICSGNPMAINVDSMFWSVLLGLIFVVLFRGAAKKASSGKPSKFQALAGRREVAYRTVVERTLRVAVRSAALR